MNCELAHERIVTAAYGELPDEQMHELERHVADCPDCRKEREQMLALKVLADALPVAEPGPNLVARCRLRLDEALDALPPKRWYERLAQRLMNNVASLQAAPVAAALLLVAGIGAGSLGGYEFAQNRAAHAAAAMSATAATRPIALPGAQADPAAAEPAMANVANVSSIVRAAGQRDGGSELQPAGAAADSGLAGRSGDPPVADAGQREFDLGGGARRLGGAAGGRVPGRPQLPGERAFAMR